MKKALVCGAGGFIGSHLVKKLKREGYWVRGVDIKHPEYWESEADEFFVLDLRTPAACRNALTTNSAHESEFDEVYQLAADMGGMGFIHSAECEIVVNNALINLFMISAASKLGVKRFFYSSSACIYRNQNLNELPLKEEDAYPAHPDNEYGWEKLYAERVLSTFGRNTDMEVRIARFQNCYGPFGTWNGGREKAPAALSRKIAEVPNNGSIDVWGDGTAQRNFIYVDDLVDAIFILTQSDEDRPTNIGTDELVDVNELVALLARISGKVVKTNHIEGPVGVLGRNQSMERMLSLGWKEKHTMEEGMTITYKWIEQQVKDTHNIV
jgi:GDP-D-mannose 3', 5'-epimerase